MSINVNVTGVQASGYAGAHDLLLLQSGDFLLFEDGGKILTSAGSTIQASFAVTGVGAVGEVGEVALVYGARISVTGVQAMGLVGQVFLWSDINDAQNPNWSDVI